MISNKTIRLPIAKIQFCLLWSVGKIGRQIAIFYIRKRSKAISSPLITLSNPGMRIVTGPLLK